ncbi:MAG: V-type ATP synthase subunit E family protein [Candidatus Jordarchaeales archaeon]|nr:V-type ATP synthase subunit E [Candidatus Jordarchaeia archaeon]
MSEEVEVKVFEETPVEERLEKIRKKIMEYAEKQASEILNEAHKREAKVIEEAERRAERKASEILRRGGEDAEREKRKIIAEAKLKARQIVTKTKEEGIRRVFEEARKKLEALASSKDYAQTLEKIIERGALTLGGGELEVVLPEKHVGINLNLEKIAEEVSKKTGVRTTIEKAKDTVYATGGAIIRRKDGSLLVDNTFEAVFERKEKELRTKIARILFT